MIQTSKLPILIVANYRTGSSALSRNLAHSNNVSCFNEPHYRLDEFDCFKQCLSSVQNSFVLKVIAEQLQTVEEYKSVLDSECFSIRLYRENKLDQIVSYYIATVTDVWFQKKTLERKPYFVEYNPDVAKYAVDRILLNDRILDNLNIKFDITTTYEQLGFIENTVSNITTPPVNIGKVIALIEKVYNESR